ncbi:DMT family transporter [Kiloniella sp. b19]|uniref:DMT family transporter n=1 Tax=Kiloniella sp. GXU_MW_B19 TaxID=3141326 RepID=UPI0031D6F50B
MTEAIEAFRRIRARLSEQNRAYLLLVAATLMWSGNFILGRAAAFEIPPVTLGFWRWIVACSILGFIGWRSVVREWHIIRPVWFRLSILGILGVSLFNTLVYAGLQTTLATNGLLINSAIPVLIVLLSAILLGKHLVWRQALGILLSTFGVLLLVVQGDLSALLRVEFHKGDLFIVTAALAWGFYSVWLAWKPRELSPLAFLTFIAFVGIIPLSVAYYFNIFDEPAIVLSAPNLGIIFYTGIMASVMAFLCWNHAVRVVGAAVAGQFVHLMPVFGAIMAVLFLGEVPKAFHAVGAGFIVVGVLFALWRKDRL